MRISSAEKEMARCGMTDYAPRFKAIAQSGLCTMDPEIGRWLRKAWGEDSGPGESMNTLSLKELVKKLLPESCDLLKDHHTAGVDATLARRLAYALFGLAKAPCRLNGGSHERRNLPLSDGETSECRLCGERF